MNQMLEDLKWKKFPVLSDGFVCLVDAMGDDAAVVQAARVSYGKDTRDGRPTNKSEIDDGNWSPDTAPDPDQIQKNRQLLRYMMRHRHTTPFEQCELKFLVRVPMDCWRQWIRHRTASVNEYSTRYTEAIDSMDKTPPDQWRLQSGTNKQGSSGFLPVEVPEIAGMSGGENLSADEMYFHQEAKRVYETRLRAGVAREQARKDLPLSTYTEAYWKCNLHNLLHFLGLRMDSHAQLEIRQYATIMGEQIVKPLFPLVWEAFEDYRLNAMNLTALDIGVIKRMCSCTDEEDAVIPWKVEFSDFQDILPKEWQTEKCRERDECIEKLKKLGLIS